MKPIYLTLVERITLIRHRLGLTAAQAAKRWRLNKRTLHAWEQGSNRPSESARTRLLQIVETEMTAMRKRKAVRRAA